MKYTDKRVQLDLQKDEPTKTNHQVKIILSLAVKSLHQL